MADDSALTPAAPPPQQAPAQPVAVAQPSQSVPPPNPPLAAATHLANVLERGATPTPRTGQPGNTPTNKLANRIDLGDPPRGRTLTVEGTPPKK